MSASNHISADLLIRAIDDELPGDERISVEEHLTACEQCRSRYRELGALTVRLETLLSSIPVSVPVSARTALASELKELEQISAVASRRRTYDLLRWGIAVAASVAIGMMLLPRFQHHAAFVPPGASQSASTTFEVDGETFVILPYSNPDLPTAASRIVQMQVPVSSLADAGLVFEPASNETSNRSVLADVLLGADGEPLGVHVIADEP